MKVVRGALTGSSIGLNSTDSTDSTNVEFICRLHFLFRDQWLPRPPKVSLH